MVYNEFPSSKFSSGPPSTDSWNCFWFGGVHFFFFFLPGGCNHILHRGASNPSSVLSLYRHWGSFVNVWVQQVPSHIQWWHFPCCILKPTRQRQSVWFWLVTLNWAKICFVTHSSCPRGLARFPKLFPHRFSSHSQEETMFCQKQIISILKKVCSWLGIFNPQEFTWGFILANPYVHAAQRISNWLLAQVAKLSSIIPSASIPQGCRTWVSMGWR